MFNHHVPGNLSHGRYNVKTFSSALFQGQNVEEGCLKIPATDDKTTSSVKIIYLKIKMVSSELSRVHLEMCVGTD